MLKSITLLGSSSGRNAGDAALLSCIMDSIDEACGERLLFEIPSLKPEFVWANYTNRVRPIGVMPWHGALRLFGIPTFKSLMRTDLSLIFDATFFDRSLYNPLFNFLSSYAALLPYAKKHGKKMGCFTVTVGPVTTPKGRNMLRGVLEMMDFITVRDLGDYRALREIGVENPNVAITNDAALMTTPPPPERIKQIWDSFGFDPQKEILALNINSYLDSWAGHKKKPLTRAQFVDIYVNGVRQALKSIDAELLFVSTQHIDEELSHEVITKLNISNKIGLLSNKVYSHHEIYGVMQHVALLSAMRLHCMILTSASTTPVIGINYLPKVRTFTETLGVNDYGLNFEDFSANSLAKHLIRGWNDRYKLRKMMETIIPKMKEQVLIAPKLVAAIHRNEDITKILEPHRVSH